MYEHKNSSEVHQAIRYAIDMDFFSISMDVDFSEN